MFIFISVALIGAFTPYFPTYDEDKSYSKTFFKALIAYFVVVTASLILGSLPLLIVHFFNLQ